MNNAEVADPNSQVRTLIRRARKGDQDALGELLDRHRAYLRVLAKRHVDGKLAVRVDASDLVQKTCLSVCRNFSKFDGTGVDEFIAWLCKIHRQNIQNEIRDHAVVQKRAVGREERINDEAAGEMFSASQSSPSQRAMQDERAVELARVLEKLPEDQREAVRLRHLEGWSLAQIAEQMDRTEAATVGLIKRGMQKLRQYFRPNQ